MAEKKDRKRSGNIDVRMLYIMPSLLALVIALTSLAYQFGNNIVDLRNTCYTIYLSVPDEMTGDELLDALNTGLSGYGLSGYTINENTRGAKMVGGELVTEQSFRIDLMNVSKKTAYDIANDLKTELNTSVMVQESRVKVEMI